MYVKLNRGHIFKDLQMVQDELKNIVVKLAPPDCKTQQILFMTNGDIGERSLVFSNERIIVEDLKEGDYYLRQLIFLSNVNQVQSEIRIEACDNNENEIYSSNSILGQPLKAIYSLITIEYQKAFLLAFAFFPDISLNKPLKILILGAGACVFPTFLLNFFSNLEITTVDIDSQVIEVGRRFFGVAESQRFNVIIDDALNYVKNYSGEPFDYIYLDICIGDSQIPTPPFVFTSTEFISQLYNNLTNEGILSINVIANEFQFSKMTSDVRGIFGNLYICKCREDTNMIIYCLKSNQEFD